MKKLLAVLAIAPVASVALPLSSAHADTPVSYTDPDTGLSVTVNVPDDPNNVDGMIPGDGQWDEDSEVWAAASPWNYSWCGFDSHDATDCIFQVQPDWETITGSMWISNPRDSGWTTFAAGFFPYVPAGFTFEERVMSKRRNYSYFWQGTMFTDTYLDNVLCARIVAHTIFGAVYHNSGPCTSSSQWIGDNPDSV